MLLLFDILSIPIIFLGLVPLKRYGACGLNFGVSKPIQGELLLVC